MYCNAPKDRLASVLVVDDVPDAAESLAALLSIHGFAVRTAHDGQAALRSATDDPPDVVLTDIGMPRMTGWEFVRRLRAQFRDGRPFVIAVTGYAKDEDMRRSAEAGVDLHLVKPVSPTELLGVLEGRTRARTTPE